MRAVNLIPADARRGGGAGAAGRSGGAAYVLLGGLAVVVALVAVWALAGHNISNKRSELARLQNETSAAQAQASRLDAYARYAKLSKDRVDTVRSLALSRFNWAQALDSVARTLPNDAWLTSMTGTVAPGVSVTGGGSSASGLRGQRAVPAIELVGCTTSQHKVGRLISRLRAVPGVDRVSISDSIKADQTAGGGGGGCRGTHASYPQFDMVLFFGNAVRPNGPASPAAAPGTAPAPTPAPSTAGASSTSSSPSGGAAPASGKTSSPSAGTASAGSTGGAK
jgi:Tfp pilus assembly protein PilN